MFIRVEHHRRRESGADLDDAPRRPVAQHRVEDESVAIRKVRIPEVIPQPVRRLLPEWHVVLIRGERLEQGELSWNLKVDSGNVGGARVENCRSVSIHDVDVGDRRIEMAGWREPEERIYVPVILV